MRNLIAYARRADLRSKLDLGASVAVIAVSVLMAWQLVRPRPAFTVIEQGPSRTKIEVAPDVPIALQGSVKLGKENAKVALVAFSDFECPYCGAFAKGAFPQVKQSYVDTGKVLFVFKHFPLESLHPDARLAATAANCAGQQDRFWDMHDKLFQQPKKMAADMLHRYSEEIGLSQHEFQACFKARDVGIDRDVAEAGMLGVTGTPAFFTGQVGLDGKVRPIEKLSGARPFADFSAALERVLSQKR